MRPSGLSVGPHVSQYFLLSLWCVAGSDVIAAVAPGRVPGVLGILARVPHVQELRSDRAAAMP